MEIKIDVPDGESGDWKVETFTVSKQDADFVNMRAGTRDGRYIKSGEYKKLTRNGHVIMSNTSAEISDHMRFIRLAKQCSDILINGLGLGVALKEILESDKVNSVTVIEKSVDVIRLSAKTYDNDPRVNIINADAFEWKPPKGKRYNAVWHDIWDNICADNLPEMTRLHRKYGRRTDWQGSWAKNECLRQRRY